MKTINCHEITALENLYGIEAKKLHENEHVQAAHITLKSGERLIQQSTPVDVFFYVLEGSGIVEIGDETKEVSKDTLIDSPANIPHGWFNHSDSVLRLLVVRTPKPIEAKSGFNK
jgi:quercetin dioxygenase-like cupin family protein